MDKRYVEIKKLLGKEFPKAKFKVKISKYSLGESINIYTDLMPEWTAEDSDNYWKLSGHIVDEITDSIKKTVGKIETARLLRERIGELLFWHVDRDAFGEILGGGNSYLHIERLEE